MRRFARAAALCALAAFALPGCVVAIGTAADHEDEEELRDADEAFDDARLLQLEERMNRIEQGLPK